ncbi:MFS transporter [Paenibacillus sp. N4]|uniref:MFS transporter n=1 Tax=Paenibacillus vietnamensis TaxID=2590547 RepID=UPI001CD0DEA4|nr:MFS transporter [Paenibacillus vietnamensis]MCA0756968.1 MFS transporter [Paenibacillus vietnamensis]
MNFSLFKQRSFALLIISEATSLFGTFFLNAAFALYVLNLTGSAGKFATVLALGMVPYLIAGPVAGVLADRFDKKKWMILLDGLRGMLCISLFVFSLFETITMPLIYFAVLFMSACEIFYGPVFISLLPSVVKEEHLVSANSFEKSINETMKILAPFLGTLLYSLAGIGPVLLVNGFTFLISALAIFYMVIPKAENVIARQLHLFRDMWDGFKVFFIDKRLTSIVSNAFLTHFFMYPFILLGFPYIIVTVLGGKETDYGIVESISTLGAILAIFTVPPMKKFGVANNIGIGILGMCVPVIPLLFLGNPDFLQLLKENDYYPVLFFGLISFLLFLAFSFYLVFFATFYQTVVPKELFGRYGAGMMLLNGIARLIGFLIFGYLFSLDSLLYAVIFFGIGMLLKIVVHIPFMIITKELEQQQKQAVQGKEICGTPLGVEVNK